MTLEFPDDKSGQRNRIKEDSTANVIPGARNFR
jgi:hypothetical protein